MAENQYTGLILQTLCVCVCLSLSVCPREPEPNTFHIYLTGSQTPHQSYLYTIIPTAPCEVQLCLRDLSVCVVSNIFHLFLPPHCCVSLRSHARLRCTCASKRCAYCLCQKLLTLGLLRSVKAQLRRVALHRSINSRSTLVAINIIVRSFTSNILLLTS
jgi:hypothetical protein